MEFRMGLKIRMGGREVKIGHSKAKRLWEHWKRRRKGKEEKT